MSDIHALCQGHTNRRAGGGPAMRGGLSALIPRMGYRLPADMRWHGGSYPSWMLSR